MDKAPRCQNLNRSFESNVLACGIMTKRIRSSIKLKKKLFWRPGNPISILGEVQDLKSMGCIFIFPLTISTSLEGVDLWLNT